MFRVDIEVVMYGSTFDCLEYRFKDKDLVLTTLLVRELVKKMENDMGDVARIVSASEILGAYEILGEFITDPENIAATSI